MYPYLIFDAYPSTRWPTPVVIWKRVMAVSMVTSLIISMVVARGTVWVKPRAIVFKTTTAIVLIRPPKGRSPISLSSSWKWTLERQKSSSKAVSFTA